MMLEQHGSRNIIIVKRGLHD